MACPFFVPTERADDLAFPHPARLPMGTAWRGTCSAPGHEREVLGHQELQVCNLGYAKSCSRLPEKRTCDAVRFGVVKESAINILVQVVFEARHRPAGLDSLEYDLTSNTWNRSHIDARVQEQAQCFLQAYLERRVLRSHCGGAHCQEKTFTTEATENPEDTTEPQ